MTAEDNLRAINQAISQAAERAERKAADITLIAVSKTHAAHEIVPLLDARHVHFGENRVQEAAAKWPPLKALYPHTVLHLIGALQSNKAAEAVRLFDVIHSLDRPRLVEALAQAMAEHQRHPEVYIQVNIGDEPQKSGVALETLESLVAHARSLHLPVVGLMCIPPVDIEPAPYFALLAKLARRYNLPRLSMGMSSDFDVAIQQGATDVRVGSAIFGPRPPATDDL